jgi:hypothetical protein
VILVVLPSEMRRDEGEAGRCDKIEAGGRRGK